MEQTTASYLKYTDFNSKIPIYYIVFGPINSTSLLSSQTAQNPNVSIPQQFATASIANASLPRPRLLTMPSATVQQVTPLSGQSTVSQVMFYLLDQNNIITNLIHNYTMKNRIVTIYGGYQQLPENLYRPVFTGMVNDIQIQSDTTRYVFYLSDIQRMIHTGPTGSLFDGATTLAADIPGPTDMGYTTGPFTIYTYGTNGFAPQTTSTNVLPSTSIGAGLPLPVYNFLRIDDEIFQYTGQTPPITGSNGSFTPGTFNNCYRADYLGGIFPNFNSTNNPPVNHSVGTQIKNFVQIGPMNPIDIALMILTSNTGKSVNGPYDLLGWPVKNNIVPSGLQDQNQGCAVPSGYIDYNGILAQKNNFCANDQMLFFIEDPVQAASFLSSQIYTFENAYPVVLMDGKLSLSIASVPLATQEPYTFDDTNTIPGSLQWASNLVSTQGFYNYVSVQSDYDNIVSDYLTIAYDPYDESINITGEAAELNIQSNGIRQAFGGNTLVQKFSNNIFSRYGFGAQKITFNSFYTGHLVNPGDKVLIQMSSLPNMATGTRGGIPLVCEIIQKNINFQNGQIQYIALATGFLARKKYGTITPTSAFDNGLFPYYASGTIAQQQYSFISQSGTTILPGGFPGDVITP